MVFWVSTTISLIGGAITIADFIHQKLKKCKNTKIKIGINEVDSSVSPEELQKLILEELNRLKEEVDNLKNE